MIKFNQSKVGLLSDIHLGNYKDDPKWHQYAIDLAHWIKKKYNELGITDIIIAGDVFHNRFEISVVTLKTACDFFEILKEFNIVITIGNHDAYYRDKSDIHSLSTFDNWSNMSIVSKVTTIDQFDSRITLCPWGVELDSIERCDIVIGHFEFRGFQIAHQKVCTSGIASQDILAKAPLILSGHFHMAAERQYGNGRIQYCGSPHQLNWGEAGDNKYIYVLDLEERKTVRILNDISPIHLKVKYSDWAAGIVDFGPLQGNIVNAIVDASFDATDPRIAAFMTAINRAEPASYKITHSSLNYSQNSLDVEFDGVDIRLSIEQFVEKLDLPSDKKEAVRQRTVDLLAKHI